MEADPNNNLNESEIDKDYEDRGKKNKCLIICLVIIIIMMLPSTLALLAIF